MNISDYIPFGKDNAISRKKLEKVTGLSDRDIREEIAMAKIMISIAIKVSIMVASVFPSV